MQTNVSLVLAAAETAWEAHQTALEEAARQLDQQKISSWTDFLKVMMVISSKEISRKSIAIVAYISPRHTLSRDPP